MTYVIEKNIPVSASTQGGVVYPFGEMQIGDSFLVPSDKALDKKVDTARSAAYLWARRNGAKLTARKVEGGLRIWRVA